MSLPTAFMGLIKAAEGEPYDLDVVNNNLDGIDLGLVKINSVFSTYNINGINGATSKFTRIRIGASNIGFIIAEFGLDIDTAAITIAACTAVPTKLPGLIPAGYRPKLAAHSIPMFGVTPVTNAGSQAVLQWGYDTNGDVLLRNNINSTYTTQTGTDMNWTATYEWGGA